MIGGYVSPIEIIHEWVFELLDGFSILAWHELVVVVVLSPCKFALAVTNKRLGAST